MGVRIRARDKKSGRVVTVLSATMPKRGSVEVRDEYGYTKTMPVRDLEALPDGEPGARLKFGDDA